METTSTVQPKVQATGCCPPLDPAVWKGRETIIWTNELFVTDHVRSVLHVPLNMGKRVLANQKLIDATGAAPAEPLMLCDETSSWGTEIYIRVTKAVPGARMTRLSGTFLTKLYEGPYSSAPKWADDMRAHVAARGKKLEKLYFAYMTCPACAKAYGKNYVVVFAQVAAQPSAAV